MAQAELYTLLRSFGFHGTRNKPSLTGKSTNCVGQSTCAVVPSVYSLELHVQWYLRLQPYMCSGTSVYSPTCAVVPPSTAIHVQWHLRLQPYLCSGTSVYSHTCAVVHVYLRLQPYLCSGTSVYSHTCAVVPPSTALPVQWYLRLQPYMCSGTSLPVQWYLRLQPYMCSGTSVYSPTWSYMCSGTSVYSPTWSSRKELLRPERKQLEPTVIGDYGGGGKCMEDMLKERTCTCMHTCRCVCTCLRACMHACAHVYTSVHACILV